MARSDEVICQDHAQKEYEGKQQITKTVALYCWQWLTVKEGRGTNNTELRCEAVGEGTRARMIFYDRPRYRISARWQSVALALLAGSTIGARKQRVLSRCILIIK